MRRLILLMLLASACDPFGVYYLQVTVAGYPDENAVMPTGYQLGDTVTFLAAEQYAEGSSGSPAGPSSLEPRAYSWSSTNESVAQVVAPGRVRMRALGEAWIRVRAGHAPSEESVRVLVVPRVAGVRISPTTATLGIGDTVSFAVYAIDSLGQVIPSIGRVAHTATILQPDARALGNSVAAANVITDDESRFLFRAFNAGTARILGQLPIYGVSTLRAEALITVR